MMINEAILHIRLVPGGIPPAMGMKTVSMQVGGPETLLGWLELQLALPIGRFHKADRVTEYVMALKRINKGRITESLETDCWATASDLLQRRDELLLAGWDEKDSETLPPLVRDLAVAADGCNFVFPSVATRLQKILEALTDGQKLPEHQCVLYDPIEEWPSVWRKVLDKLNINTPPAPLAAAPAESSLNKAQRIALGYDPIPLKLDESFRYLHSRSNTAAVEFVTAVLSDNLDLLKQTVIYCEDSNLAARLDAAFARAGLPTMGANFQSCAHPVLQVLPLSLAICWEPVDPQILLDFLNLPVSPLPGAVASKLARSLSEQPGLGSQAWEDTLKEICSPENDPEGVQKKKIENWLLCERNKQGELMSCRLIRKRCDLIVKWATARAILLDEAEQDLKQALMTAANQATLLGNLAESLGTNITEPQLARLIEESLGSGIQSQAFIESSEGPVLVRSLTEIHHPCQRLVWLGLATEELSVCNWSTSQIRELKAAGIDLDDGTRNLKALRSAEVRGFCQVRGAMLSILVPGDHEKRWHPLWLAMREQLPPELFEDPIVIEDLISAGETETCAPFRFHCHDHQVRQPQPARPLWSVPHDLLQDRKQVSASELQDRLACPLKWTFKYQARLKESTISQLPSDFLLKGNFCHSILERVFGNVRGRPTVDEAVQAVCKSFDDRLALDAAPLAQPIRHMEKQGLRKELENATRTLIQTMENGNYHFAGLEVELNGTALGKQLVGSIDCLVTREEGDEAIIDFKYAGKNKFHDLIEQGKAVQLATYAFGRAGATGRFPAVAYLILCDSLVYTPSESSLMPENNSSVVPGIDIQIVWENFVNAIENSEAWLTGEAPIPARPLQLPDQWPDGSELVLKSDLKRDQTQEVCKYCDYPVLCGKKGLS